MPAQPGIRNRPFRERSGGIKTFRVEPFFNRSFLFIKGVSDEGRYLDAVIYQ